MHSFSLSYSSCLSLGIPDPSHSFILAYSVTHCFSVTLALPRSLSLNISLTHLFPLLTRCSSFTCRHSHGLVVSLTRLSPFSHTHSSRSPSPSWLCLFVWCVITRAFSHTRGLSHSLSPSLAVSLTLSPSHLLSLSLALSDTLSHLLTISLAVSSVSLALCLTRSPSHLFSLTRSPSHLFSLTHTVVVSLSLLNRHPSHTRCFLPLRHSFSLSLVLSAIRFPLSLTLVVVFLTVVFLTVSLS